MSDQINLFGQRVNFFQCPEIKGDQWLSFGGGVQTIALLLLNWKGMIEKPTKNIIMADTGAEWPETIQYLKKYIRPFCERHNFRLVMPSYGNLVYYYMERNWVPVRFPRQCTLDFKVRAIHRWLKIWSPNHENHWYNQIGISTDEVSRAKNDPKDGYDNRWPLLEENYSRTDCKRLIGELTEDLPNGPWPEPPKSGCFCCPFQRTSEYGRLKRDHPELFYLSSEMEQRASNKYIEEGRKADMWLRGKPLKELFPDREGQTSLMDFGYELDETLEVCGGNCFL